MVRIWSRCILRQAREALDQRFFGKIVGVRCRVFPDDIRRQILYSVLINLNQVLLLKGENKQI
jgi:hypothetical protein